MVARSAFPEGIDGIAFRTGEVADLGLARSRTRRSDIDHPFHGVVGRHLELSTVIGQCRAFEATTRDGQAFSHVTALALYGAPLPAHPDELHVSVPFPRTPPRGRGIRGHSLRQLRVTVVHDLPVATPAMAWCQAASLLDREDLVAVGDFLVTGPRRAGHRLPGLTTRDDLSRTVNDHRRSPGAGRMTWALSRIRSGVDSRPETLLRLLLVRSGLPSVVVDHPIPVEGGLVLHADLAFVAERVALDYEGDGHRTDQVVWRRDITRRELMEDAHWRVIRVTADDVFLNPQSLIARIRRILLENRVKWSMHKR